MESASPASLPSIRWIAAVCLWPASPSPSAVVASSDASDSADLAERRYDARPPSSLTSSPPTLLAYNDVMGGGDVVVVAKGDILMRPVSPLPGWRTVLLPIGLLLSSRKDLAATMTPVDVTTGKFPTEPPPPPPKDDDGRRRR